MYGKIVMTNKNAISMKKAFKIYIYLIFPSHYTFNRIKTIKYLFYVSDLLHRQMCLSVFLFLLQHLKHRYLTVKYTVRVNIKATVNNVTATSTE